MSAAPAPVTMEPEPRASGAAGPRPRKRLGELLVEAGLVTEEQVADGLEYQKVHGGRLGSVLVSLGHLSESDLEGTLARLLGLRTCDVESLDPPDDLLGLFPRRIIERYEFIPISRDGDELVVGMTDPRNYEALDHIRFVSRARSLDIRLITESTFSRFVRTRYGSAIMLEQISSDRGLDGVDFLQGNKRVSQESDRETEANRSPVVRLANYLLRLSIERRASDIHMEPYESFCRIRFRVDGALYTVLTPPRRLHVPLVSRIKILSGMDIAEHRKPQDGHLVMLQDRESIHFRVSTIPTVHGEKCVLRLLKKEAHLADLGHLGFSPEQLRVVTRCAHLSQGLVLVTGPTGSGKTTTLHAVLNKINESDINIVTVEDPVECAIPGVNHVQIQDQAGLTFAAALRSILRQDPDVVFVGEMRDGEVGGIAIKAALTGHLVLSTLHTNGVIETFNRLLDMDIEPYLLASCLKLVLAQRLLRRLCSRCARRLPVPRQVAERYGLTEQEVSTALYKEPAGCSECLDTGYRGRVAVYESLVPGDRIRTILRAGGNEEEIARAARESNFLPMLRAGVQRALAGETSFAEVERVLATEA